MLRASRGVVTAGVFVMAFSLVAALWWERRANAVAAAASDYEAAACACKDLRCATQLVARGFPSDLQASVDRIRTGVGSREERDTVGRAVKAGNACLTKLSVPRPMSADGAVP
jgi:hypothetical protein